MLASAPRLSDPLWHPQTGETAAESAAFGAYLTERSQAAVCAAMGWSPADVGSVAVRWCWYERTLAYDRSIAPAGWDARADRARAVLAARAETMSQVLADLTSVLAHEARAHRMVCEAAPANVPALSVKDTRSLAAIAQEIAGKLLADSTPARAQEAAPGEVNFDALDAADLQRWDEIVRRARGQ